MKKRIIWLVVSGLMALSLVLASCAPKVTEEKEVVTEKKEVVTEEKEVVTEKKEVVTEKREVEMVVDALGRLVPKPQYGGWLNLADTADPRYGFSNSGLFTTAVPQRYIGVTNERLLVRDRLKGPHGSGEWDGMQGAVYPLIEHLTGNLAESFEIIQPDTLIFHIRKGIHWQDKAPTYGLELTAEDVVYTFMARLKRPGSAIPKQEPYYSNMKKPEESVYIHPDDPWAVVFRSAPGRLGELWERVAAYSYIVPEALGPIEGEGFGDWRGVVGTGPMLLTDYVRGTSLTWERNPNYWQKDPFHPQNQLPYIDGIKGFIIPDTSTQFAALRTGKIDILGGIDAEDAESLMRTSPQLLVKEYLSSGDALHMRHDTTPFGDVRVRRAMMMAIDHDELVRDYYGGKAVKFYWPSYPIPEHSLAYRPLEEMPQSVQELYEYHPDKAKKLLAEAGYPNGFTTSVTVSAASEREIDLASVVAAYWAKVGVTLKIDVREDAVFAALKAARSYPHGNMHSLTTAEFPKYMFSRVGGVNNFAWINDPLLEQTAAAVVDSYFDWAELQRIQREATPALQELALHIKLPIPYSYIMWQPWLKHYDGMVAPEYMAIAGGFGTAQLANYPLWIDQKLKKSMGR